MGLDVGLRLGLGTGFEMDLARRSTVTITIIISSYWKFGSNIIPIFARHFSRLPLPIFPFLSRLCEICCYYLELAMANSSQRDADQMVGNQVKAKNDGILFLAILFVWVLCYFLESRICLDRMQMLGSWIHFTSEDHYSIS